MHLSVSSKIPKALVDAKEKALGPSVLGASFMGGPLQTDTGGPRFSAGVLAVPQTNAEASVAIESSKWRLKIVINKYFL